MAKMFVYGPERVGAVLATTRSIRLKKAGKRRKKKRLTGISIVIPK